MSNPQSTPVRIIVGLVAGGVFLAAQTPVFRSAVEGIEIDVVVLDGAGRFVSDVRPEEFQVYEAGQQRRLAGTTLVRLPPADVRSRTIPPSGAAGTAVSDVAANPDVTPGRVYALVFDDLNADPAQAMRMKAAGTEFVEEYVEPGDQVLITYASGRPDVPATLSSDRATLLSRIRVWGGTLALDGATPKLLEDQYTVHKTFTARGLLDTLDRVIASLAAIRGRRKALLLFTEGFPILDRSAGPFLILTETNKTCFH